MKTRSRGLLVASPAANSFPGIFPGGYTTLTLVTDSSGQVVRIHLADTNPPQRSADITDTGGYHSCNFLAQRDKSAGQLVIKNEFVREGVPAGGVVVDSLLIDPGAADPDAPRPHILKKSSKASTPYRQPRTGKVIKRSGWYMTMPLVSVILRATGNR